MSLTSGEAKLRNLYTLYYLCYALAILSGHPIEWPWIVLFSSQIHICMNIYILTSWPTWGNSKIARHYLFRWYMHINRTNTFYFLGVALVACSISSSLGSLHGCFSECFLFSHIDTKSILRVNRCTGIFLHQLKEWHKEKIKNLSVINQSFSCKGIYWSFTIFGWAHCQPPRADPPHPSLAIPSRNCAYTFLFHSQFLSQMCSQSTSFGQSVASTESIHCSSCSARFLSVNIVWSVWSVFRWKEQMINWPEYTIPAWVSLTAMKVFALVL